MNLYRRLDRLEKELTRERIVLQMADGRTVTLGGGDDRAVDLLAGGGSPVRMIARRVGQLKDRYAIHSSGKPKIGLRVRVSLQWKGPANLGTSNCQRTLHADNGLMELVKLDGGEENISDAELETFIATFPIQVAGRVRAR